VHRLNDATSLAHAPELCLKPGIDPPMAGTNLFRQPHPIERSQPSHSRGLPDWISCRLHDELKNTVRHIAQDRPVKTREPLGRNLLLELARGLDFGFTTELSCDAARARKPWAT
jgi:hypothetical protein